MACAYCRILPCMQGQNNLMREVGVGVAEGQDHDCSPGYMPTTSLGNSYTFTFPLYNYRLLPIESQLLILVRIVFSILLSTVSGMCYMINICWLNK